MTDIADAFGAAGRLIAAGDAELIQIVLLSFRVSLTATILAMLAGLPLGAALALVRFRGRDALVVLLNTLMGLPPVVLGLLVYLLLTRGGPLGGFGLLFTPTAMIIVQAMLVAPIIAALARQTIEDAWREYEDQLRSLGATAWRAIGTLIWDTRHSLLTALLAGFGRASAEVGAILIVGGNIRGYTRMMTAAIALETAKGDLALALGLGIILMVLVLAINAAAYAIKRIGEARYG